MSNTRSNYPAVNTACTDVVHRLDADFCSSSQELQSNKIDNFCNIIRQRIHTTGTDPAMTQPHNGQGSFNENYLHYIVEELLKQPDNSFNRLSSCVATTGNSMRFSAVLPMGGSAIASSNPPVPCSDCNSNGNDITNMTSAENMGLVTGSMIDEGAILLGC
jgi:hypothetical protein